MKKLQQFYIMKFSSGMLDFFGYHLKRVRGGSSKDSNDVRNNHELIALGDNQALRTIRNIRYERNPDILRYDPELLKSLLKRKKELKKKPFTKEVKKEISIINTQIDDMLFVPEYISVVIEDICHYQKIIQDGFFVNGYKYKRLMCSAGQARVNTVIFIREDFEDEVKRRLKCGAKQVKITKNKYNAYFALSSSSTYEISTPKFLLVDDCEIEMTKHVDWIEKIPKEEKTRLGNNERVKDEWKTLTFNLFDGCGAISVGYAQKIATELELNYIPSAFCIRCAYVKGMVFVVDFKQYAAEHGVEYVTDKYGNQQKVSEMDLILTKSQFKLWNAYDSVEQYQEECDKVDFKWGVARATPKNDDTSFMSNYQFCQALSLESDKDIEELCQPTIDWLSGIAGKDANIALLYLFGSVCNNPDLDYDNILDMTSDNMAKAILLNNKMLNDEYIRSTITQSINKKIRESYLGKLLLEGNFSTMIPDMYAFMQHAFGQEVTGVLKENEYYSHFWNERNVDHVVAMRSPLTWRSEVNDLPLKNNELTDKWFKYLTSGIVYNVWGCDCIIHADSDFDGDICATTNNPVFLRCRYDNLPITYTKSTVDKEEINEDELYEADIQSFNSTIGSITNISTTFYELLAKYEGKSEYQKEQDEIIERLKLIRKSQGDSIDKAKGIKIEPMPRHWTKYLTDVPKGETEERMNFCNSVVADRKPYFFRYLYGKENVKLKNFMEKKEIASYTRLGKSISSLLTAPEAELSEKERKYKHGTFEKNYPLLDCNGRMNRICHYMESNLQEISRNRTKNPDYVFDIMYRDRNRNFPQEHIDTMSKFYKEYKAVRKRLKMEERIGANNRYLGTETIESWCRRVFSDIQSQICKDVYYLTDLAIYVCYELFSSRTKSFVWDIFGDYIVENVFLHRQKHVYLPVISENGKIKYEGKQYELKEINIDTV